MYKIIIFVKKLFEVPEKKLLKYFGKSYFESYVLAFFGFGLVRVR